ncbi:STAS domain-containing protein [Mesobacillus selenatarsenatis]|uniref:RsbR, positive regulator of sigma-B n=1 Tax=Mesobacillus selenatarsenatis (strain DSM 18680 / JCM 14380 / FERM P-15431 / SF-1) TaxID=1321606 RepID=A0A0A8X3U5_MESS1|nr:STAS domain-containing protein [Mesobacillus selenatarsenatis]GAM12801.1 RsbR, positive regulator of sigma-B [Mesobacillus selenatarsenatis SF-1]
MTSTNNIKLYDFITENPSILTNKWLSMRANNPTSVYSCDNHQAEARLREQNGLFIKTVAKVLVAPGNEVNEEIKTWAQTVAMDRVETRTPIHEVIHQFGVFRGILWEHIHQFVVENKGGISDSEILHWSTLIHSTFDTIIETFAEKYYNYYNDRLSVQSELINELSAPIIPLSDSIGVLPLVGEIDTQRAKYITESILIQSKDYSLTHLFIDLSGVSIIDTMVANQLFQIIDILKLIGVKVYISGIRPEIAQTAVQLGINFNKIPTQATLKQALKANKILISDIHMSQK